MRPQVRVVNAGTSLVFIAFGNSSVAATAAAGIPIVPNAPESITIPATATHVAAIYASGSGTVYFTSGFGA